MSRRIRFQDIEKLCQIDLGAAFGCISHEYTRIMRSTSPQDALVSPVPLSRQLQAFSPSSPQETTHDQPGVVFAKPYSWNLMPSDRSMLAEIFLQVQQDAEFFMQRGVHILSETDPIRAEHAALCLATNHVLKDYDLEVY